MIDTRTYYGLGYQEALADVLSAIEDDGLAGALRWIESNAQDGQVNASANSLLTAHNDREA